MFEFKIRGARLGELPNIEIGIPRELFKGRGSGGVAAGKRLEALLFGLTASWFGSTVAARHTKGRVSRLSNTLAGGLGGRMPT